MKFVKQRREREKDVDCDKLSNDDSSIEAKKKETDQTKKIDKILFSEKSVLLEIDEIRYFSGQ